MYECYKENSPRQRDKEWYSAVGMGFGYDGHQGHPYS